MPGTRKTFSLVHRRNFPEIKNHQRIRDFGEKYKIRTIIRGKAIEL